MNKGIQMVDLKGQYDKIKDEIDASIQEVLNTTRFIGGPQVLEFEKQLSQYLGGTNVISCANGTDALMIAFMTLDLSIGDEVIIPAFNYVSTIEVLSILGLTPIMVDVDPKTGNISTVGLDKVISHRTKAIVPVHLYGQSVDMDAIMSFAQQYGLYVIEDNAQAIGASYISSTGVSKKTGTIGHIGCTSFFPSKNLGCYGDGGALYTSDESLAQRIKMITRHGQHIKYHHEIVGVNSRLDAIQATILKVKLQYLDQYAEARQRAASTYDRHLIDIENLMLPHRCGYSTHVFHQYTLQLKNGLRDGLKAYLGEQGIPSMIYYPLPLYDQGAYKSYAPDLYLPVTERLCIEVLSLPMHTELSEDTIAYICGHVRNYLETNNN